MVFAVKLWAAPAHPVGPISEAVRQQCKLTDFYQQGTAVHGLPIVASARVSPYALKEAAWILDRLLGKRPDILQCMAKRGAFVTVMAHNEYTTDVPDHARLKPRVYWDRRFLSVAARKTCSVFPMIPMLRRTS